MRCRRIRHGPVGWQQRPNVEPEPRRASFANMRSCAWARDMVRLRPAARSYRSPPLSLWSSAPSFVASISSGEKVGTSAWPASSPRRCRRRSLGPRLRHGRSGCGHGRVAGGCQDESVADGCAAGRDVAGHDHATDAIGGGAVDGESERGAGSRSASRQLHCAPAPG